jgi:hypothetical protein
MRGSKRISQCCLVRLVAGFHLTNLRIFPYGGSAIDSNIIVQGLSGATKNENAGFMPVAVD